MPTRQAFPADAQGCRFKNEVDAWPVDFSAILAMLDQPNDSLMKSLAESRRAKGRVF